MIGAPGSGKGTQAARVSKEFSLPHISSGEILRHEVREGSSIGGAVKDHLDRGTLVPDAILIDLLRERIGDPELRKGYVLDGFPRTVEQAEAAYAIAQPVGAAVQVAVQLEVPQELLIERLLARAREEGRSDDRPEVIEGRLAVYFEHARSLLDYYRARETVVTVDGAGDIDEVSRSLIAELEELRSRLPDPTY